MRRHVLLVSVTSRLPFRIRTTISIKGAYDVTGREIRRNYLTLWGRFTKGRVHRMLEDNDKSFRDPDRGHCHVISTKRATEQWPWSKTWRCTNNHRNSTIF